MARFTLLSLLLKILLVIRISEETNVLAFSTSAENKTRKPNVEFRRGCPSDEPGIAWTLAKNWMNPFGIYTANNFLVAVDVNNDDADAINRVVGWAQIRKLGVAQRDPGRYDAPPGSYDLEQGVDAQIWQEFEEDDTIQVPTGWDSLPWSKKYRDMEVTVKQGQARRAQLVEQAERERRETQIQIWELTTLYVDPDYRDRGIGSEVVQRLCQEYEDTGKALSNLFVVTDKPKFYQRLGLFEEVTFSNDIPAQIAGGTNFCMRGKLDRVSCEKME